MAVEADVEKLAKAQSDASTNFFGADIQNPPTQLFEVAEKIRTEKLFKVEPIYLPQRSFPEGTTYPGQKVPMSPNLYRYIKEKWVDKDANSLPGQWVLMDVTKRPNYKDGKQMYPDTPRFKSILAGLREQHQIEVPDWCKHIPTESRFGVSPDEIDGRFSHVSKEVAKVLSIEPETVTTPSYAAFYYVGNLSHPEFGTADTSEWFRNSFGAGRRPGGGRSLFGGLSGVGDWGSADRNGGIGFRFQFSFPQ